VEAKGFGPGTNLRRGLNLHNFSSGPVFDPRPGPLWVRPCSRPGLGTTKQGLQVKYSIPLLQERDEGAGADGLSALVETLRPKQEILAVGFERSFVRISASGQWTRPQQSATATGVAFCMVEDKNVPVNKHRTFGRQVRYSLTFAPSVQYPSQLASTCTCILTFAPSVQYP
jgi:hypothetical protein